MQEKKDQARISSWVGIFLGACLSGFLWAVAHYDDVDGDFAWFANTHSGAIPCVCSTHLTQVTCGTSFGPLVPQSHC